MSWREREKNQRAKEIKARTKRENKEKTQRLAKYLKQKGIYELPELEKKYQYISYCKKHDRIVAYGFEVPYSDITCECKEISAPSKNVKKSATIHFSIKSSKVGKFVACSNPSKLNIDTHDISKVGCGHCRQRLQMAIEFNRSDEDENY